MAPKRVAPEALARAASRYDWPGNIRELQNAIERAFALSAADVITLDDLPPPVRERPAAAARRRAVGPAGCRPSPRPSAGSSRPRCARASGNKNEAARLLGIDRQRLYRKIEKYGL